MLQQKKLNYFGNHTIKIINQWTGCDTGCSILNTHNNFTKQF